MLLQVIKVKKTKRQNYVRYSFSVIKLENIKVKKKVFIKH